MGQPVAEGLWLPEHTHDARLRVSNFSTNLCFPLDHYMYIILARIDACRMLQPSSLDQLIRHLSIRVVYGSCI